MTGKTFIQQPARKATWAGVLMLALAGQIALAQAAAGRFVGTITAINGDTLTVKADSGEMRQVEVTSTAALKRVEPGQKDLSAAATIQLGDLATGDRVLVRLDPTASGDIPQAAQIITIKQTDVAEKQQQDREAWARSGVGGLVKSVDPAAGVIILTTGSGATMKIVKMHVTTSTVLRRYAPASVRYDLAQPGPIDAIQPGDQLRARGTKNADGTEIDAAEIVSGSFRNISGTIASLDASSSSFSVKDLLDKKASHDSHHSRCADARAAGNDGASLGCSIEGHSTGRRRSLTYAAPGAVDSVAGAPAMVQGTDKAADKLEAAICSRS